jgi:hypothetical protein
VQKARVDRGRLCLRKILRIGLIQPLDFEWLDDGKLCWIGLPGQHDEIGFLAGLGAKSLVGYD